MSDVSQVKSRERERRREREETKVSEALPEREREREEKRREEKGKKLKWISSSLVSIHPSAIPFLALGYLGGEDYVDMSVISTLVAHESMAFYLFELPYIDFKEKNDFALVASPTRITHHSPAAWARLFGHPEQPVKRVALVSDTFWDIAGAGRKTSGSSKEKDIYAVPVAVSGKTPVVSNGRMSWYASSVANCSVQKMEFKLHTVEGERPKASQTAQPCPLLAGEPGPGRLSKRNKLHGDKPTAEEQGPANESTDNPDFRSSQFSCLFWTLIPRKWQDSSVPELEDIGPVRDDT
ncbi:hypothetical protein UY3_07327 [Chelonia mydas]|uniref:Uncharacterized protein n=1 Tax=Chelonia mydas TaxID=8469 RepID=M7BIA8_CHEMY|nr:hypothetical protein UY3_07327 [Chelonia mydas]